MSFVKDKFIGNTRKIRTVSLDTNIVIDLASEASGYSTSLTQKSLEIFSILTARNVNMTLMGCPVVRKELQYGGLEALYDAISDRESAKGKDVKNLARAYLREINIKPADALIVASLSISKTDVFITRDNELAKESVLNKIKEINKPRKIPTPVIVSPSELHERIFLTERSICISHSIIHPQFRPKISYPKRLL